MRKKVFGMIAVMALAGALATGCGNKDTKETETPEVTEKVEETKADESDAQTEQTDTESETNAE